MSKLKPEDIQFMEAEKMKDAVKMGSDGDLFRVRLVVIVPQGYGVASEVTAKCKGMAKDRSTCVLVCKLENGQEIDVPIPHEPLSRQPVVLDIKFRGNPSAVPAFLRAASYVNTHTADTIIAEMHAPDAYDRWAAAFSQQSGIQIVPNASAQHTEVGRALGPLEKTHEHLLLMLNGIRDYASGAAYDPLKGVHLAASLQMHLDEWTVGRIKHRGGTVDSFLKDIAEDPNTDRAVAFAAACKKKFVKK